MRTTRLFFSVNLTLLVLAACFAILLSGCGGGGTTPAPEKSPEPETFYPLSSQTRIFQPGDTWTYDDHEKVTVVSSSLDGVPVLTRITGGDGTGEGGYDVEYFSQKTDGEIVVLGKRGINHTVFLPDDPAREVRLLPAPQSVLFGTWAQGKSVSFNLLYDNYNEYLPAEGGYATLTIVGTEKVKTPLGTFDTWKVEAKPDGQTQFFQVSGTYWYAPQLGIYVRAHVVISSVDPEIGGETDITLKSTNIPLGMPQTAP